MSTDLLMLLKLLLYCFWNYNFIFEKKLVFTRHLSLNELCILKSKILKTVKMKKCYRGVRKVQKKGHVFFEWLLIIDVEKVFLKFAACMIER